LPRLSVFHNDYGPHGFEAIAINLNEDMEAIVKVWARQNTNVYLRDNNSVWPVYKHNSSIPLNYVIDTAGVIRFWQEGYTEAQIVNVIETYLPDPIEHDVGVTRLLAPSGSRDSGATLTPACSLTNRGHSAETYPVRMRIGTEYDTTVMITNHGPGEQLYVEFPAWTPRNRGQAAVACTTELAGDDIGSNNVRTGTVSVDVYDIAATAILAPADSVDSGVTIVPSVEVRNLGTIADMAKVRFYIGDFYADSVNVPLQPGRTDTAMMDAWVPGLLGTFPVRCTVATLRAEMVPANNELSKSVVVLGSGVEEPGPGTARFALLGSGRNPSVSQATIRYSLATASPVDLRIFSATGELVRVLEAGTRQPGLHQVVWDGTNELGQPVGRGTYFCRMTAGGFRAVAKLTTVE
jgi:hypothetical protein